MKYDAAVIGLGFGGEQCAIRLAQLGLKTVCFEQKSAATQLKKYPLDVVKAHAKVIGPQTIRAEGRDIQANAIILATGSTPIGIPYLSFDDKRVLSPSSPFLEEGVPKKLLVVGAGGSGLEMASRSMRSGSQVEVVELLPSICIGYDSTLTHMLFGQLKKQGMTFLLNTQMISGAMHPGGGIDLLVRPQNGIETTLQADAVLVAIGRRPNSQNLGLEELKIDMTLRGSIIVDAQFRTAIPTIYAIGNLIDRPMRVNRAFYEAIAVADTIASTASKLDYGTIPNVIYAIPELASVGMSEAEAKELKRPLKIGMSTFKANPRAKWLHETDGIVKVVADAQSDRILGLHILASRASDMIGIGVLSLVKRCTLSELGSLPFVHFSFSEAIKEACLHALCR